MRSSTLQISLAPSDLRLARVTLPHQLRQWHSSCDQVLVTVESRQSKGRFGSDWEEGLLALPRLLDGLASEWPKLRWKWVDYDPPIAREVARSYFGRAGIPEKDFRGGAFYSYFFGLWCAETRYVLHCDSDMLFGGGSTGWLREAIDLFEVDPEIAFVSPLPGPPADPNTLRSQPFAPSYQGRAHTFVFRGMSTRVFLTDRDRFPPGGSIPVRRPRLRAMLRALAYGNPPGEIPEILITRAMRDSGMKRVDFLGTDPGMWTLHPPYRTSAYLDELPELIRKIENVEIPEQQRGHHDIVDALFDWSEARRLLRRKAWWRRLRAG